MKLHCCCVELLQLLKAHLDYRERTKLLTSCEVMADSTVVMNPRSVICQHVSAYPI